MNEIEEKALDAALEVGKDALNDIVRPTSKSIGENMGLLVDGVFGWLGCWGEVQKIRQAKYIEDYKQRIAQKIADVPAERLQEPPLRIAGPAIEESKFYLEEEYYREMFANLVASSCDSQKSNYVHPGFVDIIKQMESIDAVFVKVLAKYKTLPAVHIQQWHKDGLITPYLTLIVDFYDDTSIQGGQLLSLTKSIDNLLRLGLIQLNQGIIELDYDYELFREHWLCKAICKQFDERSQLKLVKYRVEFTQLGASFVKCCALLDEESTLNDK